MQMRNVLFAGFAVLTMGLSLGLPIISEAGVFWSDDFENHLNIGDGVTPWDTGACVYIGVSFPAIDGCNPGISTDVAHSGTHSLKSHFTDACGGGLTPPGCGVYLNRNYSPTTEIWMRWYEYTVNFTYNPIVTKDMINESDQDANNGIRMYWSHMWGSREMGAGYQHSPTAITCPPDADNPGFVDLSCNLSPNRGHVPQNNLQWYCIETHATQGTTNGNNAVVEVFVNGTQTLGYYDLPSNSSNAHFVLVSHISQSGVGDRYIDDLAVGDTRIGCAGTPTANTAPPSAPTGLLVR